MYVTGRRAVVESDDDGDLQPSALPPPPPPLSALPPVHVEPAAASADSGDESDEDILHS